MSKARTNPQVKAARMPQAPKPAAPPPPTPKNQSLLAPGNFVWWLAGIAFALYLPTVFFGFTELDDSIFIREFAEYNEDISNLTRSFARGLFNATQDPYYRPLFMDSIILNYRFSGIEIGGYHVVNILFHVLTVILLFRLLHKLGVSEWHSFLLTLIFTVHPVLTQAVAWVPGRNDTMLAIFSLSFFHFAIDYQKDGKIKRLVFSVIFLLAAFFTKETALFTAPAAFVLLVLVLKTPVFGQRNLILYATWAACFGVWYAARSAATIHITTGLNAGQVFGEFLQRLPLIIQYLGKILLPFNLSVFPTQQDTVIWYGLATAVILAALIGLSEKPDWRIIGAGFAIFILFLAPALLVPSNLNEQSFEHRLYLPIIGILLVLHETALFKRTDRKTLAYVAGGICALFAVLNLIHQRNFTDPLTFWQAATRTTPNSAYANMMRGAREKKVEDSYELFRKAYRLNPNEKYLGYYYGKMLQLQDSILESEKYFLAEKKRSGYYECDFYLARVAMTKGDTSGAISYMETYLKADPGNPQANNNLLLMLASKGEFAKARAHAQRMSMAGMPVPQELMAQINGR